MQTMPRFHVLAISLLVAAISLVSCQKEVVAPAPTISLADTAAIDQVMDSYVDAGAVPFLYARIEDKHGRVVYEHSTVNEDLLPGVKVNADTWIRIWSMSKIVTISVLMDLVEDGRVRLDDPVAKYIPEFADLQVAVSSDGSDLGATDDASSVCPLQYVPATTTMSVSDLINHKAGFTYGMTGIPCFDEIQMASNLATIENSENLIQAMAELPLLMQPGTAYHYGTSTTVLGLVAERVTGKSLKTLVEERVTTPLGIDGLRYGLPAGAALLPRVSGGDGSLQVVEVSNLAETGAALPGYDPDHKLYLGGEGMLSTVDAYADFLRMLLNRGELNGHRFLEKATIAEMVAPHTMVDNEWGHNGYNIWVSSAKAGPAGLWSGGGFEGTHYWIDPHREFVGVIVTQILSPPESASGRDAAFRHAVYSQIVEN
ncbi:MAG: beta-lactamase family protein [Gammaproteobacteria bacterium]|nr:beta-lactamase family protein [Gammaproteobacteria bacterium]